jgi:hypothetical protein
MLTKIINIEARWMRSVTDFLPAGDYKVEYIGVAQGGQYNAWNYRYNYYPWWSNQYQIDSSEFSFSTGRLSENWGSDTLALANAKNTTFVLTKDGNVTFWIYDTLYDDNTGGISLRVTSIPTPATNITLSNSNIAENQAVNTVIGDFTSTDPDPGDTFTYSLVAGAGDTDNSFFTITGSQLRTKAVFEGLSASKCWYSSPLPSTQSLKPNSCARLAARIASCPFVISNKTGNVCISFKACKDSLNGLLRLTEPYHLASIKACRMSAIVPASELG